MVQEQREWFESATSAWYNWHSDANIAFAAKNAGSGAAAAQVAQRV